MALDSAMGFVPLSTPLESQVMEIPVEDGAVVFKGQLVKLDTGAILPHVFSETGADVAGVCMEYKTGVADLSVKAIVIVDPSMVYRIDSDGTALSTDLGFFGDMITNAGNTSTGLATGQADDSSFAVAPTAPLFLQHLGIYDVVSDETNTWIKVRVVSTLFSDRFGLIS